MKTGNGINTVSVNGKLKHITELDDLTLCNEWLKLKKDNDQLYEFNREVSKGWRGFILKIIGINLPKKEAFL
ncbi:hypothetical protein SRABI13_04361 [Erwinia aphidicola]|uniref:hypothetical protein n=1 Tax=Erwinia aphidicola TaxID=68334 RepID=UPI001DBA63AC|nr:hypothetical protein [Erwinia aphidicola]CAH0300249.1 hypothetical protein SRABI13_04361 [Erwinia aphidicola]